MMKIKSLSLLFAAAVILSACGGGGAGTGGTTTPSTPTSLPSELPKTTSSSIASSSSSATTSAALSSSSFTITSSSASSSSAPSSISSLPASTSSASSTSSAPALSSSSVASAGCSKIDGNIFIDCTDPAWNGLQAFEQTKDYKTQGPVTDGTQGQMAIWHTLVSADQGHNNVIEVQFKDNDSYNANVHFFANSPSDTRDMSAYATGKLIFDIKVLNAGKFSPQLNVMLECIYPCISHDHPIAVPALNQWTTVEVPIAEFIEGGFNITKTGIAFEIVPEWNKQNGVQFQIDNIRWVKGAGVAPTPETHCFEQRFETWNLPYHFDTLAGSPSLTTGALTKIISTSEMTPNWSSTSDKFGYAPKVDVEFAPCEFTDGKLSAQVYLPKSYVDDGKMRVGLYYEDYFGRRAYFPSTSAASLKADAWSTISTPLVLANNVPAFSSSDAAFDIHNINHVGVYFDANGKPANVGGMLKVDNIFTSGKRVVPNVPGYVTTLCNAGTQSFAGGTQLGFGFAAAQHFYVRAALSNAVFVGSDQKLTSFNTSSVVAQSNSTTVIFDVTANSSIAASELIYPLFDYQATDANQTTSITLSVHSTATDAVYATNKLASNTINLVSGVTCSSSSSSSSVAKSSSSSSKSSSSSSAQTSSSSSSSSSSSVASSSSSSAPAASSSSSFSSKASCSVKVDSGSSALGFGLVSGTHGYLVIKLSNANYASPSAQVSIANASIILASDNSVRAVFDITANSSLPSSTPVSFSFGFQQLDSTASVSRIISLYDTASAAMNEVNALSSSSATIAAPGCL